MKSYPELRPVWWDGLAVLAVAALAVVSALLLWRAPAETGAVTAVISADGEERERIDLTALSPTTITVESRGYTLRVLLSEEEVRVTESDCPTQDCVHTGAIHGSGQSIVCLPARVTVRLEGGTPADGPDLVIG